MDRYKPSFTSIIRFAQAVFLVLALVFFYKSQYENKLYDDIVNYAKQKGELENDGPINILNTVHELLNERAMVYKNRNPIIDWPDAFVSADVHLMEARGACGSYSHVLGRAMQRANYDIRIGQMKCGNTWGCHIILESKVNGKWIVLDPLYNLIYRNEKGEFAGFDEISSNWDFYSKQIPSHYNGSFRYEDIRYTNWNKVPVILPLVKAILSWFFVDNIEEVSLKSYILNTNQIFSVISGFTFILLQIVFLKIRRRI